MSVSASGEGDFRMRVGGVRVRIGGPVAGCSCSCIPSGGLRWLLSRSLWGPPLLHSSLASSREGGAVFLPPPGFLFSLIVDWGRLLNFCVLVLLSEHLEVLPLGCHQILVVLNLKQVDMLFVISFQNTMIFFCSELQNCLGLMISLSRFAHLWNSAALG